MNRCITCGKLVTRPRAQNRVKHDGHEYLVCCPLCEKEFDRDPEHYVAVLRAAIGDYAWKAHSQASLEAASDDSDKTNDGRLPNLHLLQNLESNFAGIRQRFADLERHFDQIAESGGLNGMRNALHEHRRMMDEFRREISVFAGVCKFVTSVTQSSVKAHA